MNTPRRKPCKGDKNLSCLQHSVVGAWYNGGDTPACSLISLSGLCLAGPNNPLNLSNHLERNGQAIIFRTQCDFLLTIEVSTFSSQVSAIEARDAAIFTRIKRSITPHFPEKHHDYGVWRVGFWAKWSYFWHNFGPIFCPWRINFAVYFLWLDNSEMFESLIINKLQLYFSFSHFLISHFSK